jgi:hypothetical protein
MIAMWISAPRQECEIRFERIDKRHDAVGCPLPIRGVRRWHGGVRKSEEDARFSANTKASQRFRRLNLAPCGEPRPRP